MKTLLAFVLAISSAVVGAVVGRSRRPLGRISVWKAIVVGVLAALVAEGGTVFWVGAPLSPLQPVLGGLLLGLVSGFFSGRKPPPPDSLPPSRPK